MQDFDTIVIGSGAGGLTAALALAQAGEKVLILEQHSRAGGLCHSFQRGPYRFSPGVHYIGQLGPSGSLREIYEGLGVAGDLTFFEMNPDGFEHIRIGEERFDLPAGKDAMIERFKACFPHQNKGIEGYFSLVHTINKEMRCIPETKGLLDFVTIPFRTWNMGHYAPYSLDRMLKKYFTDPLLRSFIAVQCGDHGLPPSRIPFIMHVSVTGHYMDGGFYPKGGAGTIPDAFVKALRNEKAEVLLSTAVDKILIETHSSMRTAVGLRTADGAEFTAKKIISNASPHLTYNELVGREYLSSGLRRKLDRTTYSISAVTLFLVTNLDLASLGFDSGNYWYAPDSNFESIFSRVQDPSSVDDEFPAVFFGITTLKDASASTNGPHTIEVVRLLTYEAFSKYQNTLPGKRPLEYIQLKEKLTAAMLRSVEKIIPDLRDHIIMSELATPLTNERFVRSTRGACYGTEKVLRQIGPFSFKQVSEIKNLYLCGASFIHGVSGATTSGLTLAAAILDCRPSELLKKSSSLKTLPTVKARG